MVKDCPKQILPLLTVIDGVGNVPPSVITHKSLFVILLCAAIAAAEQYLLLPPSKLTLGFNTKAFHPINKL